MRHHLRLPAAALGLAALLALPAGPVGIGAMAQAEEVVIESEETVTIDAVTADGLDALDLGDLSMDLTAPTVAPADTPTPTPTPTATPTPEPTATPAPPWITSVHYPKDKINFETEIWDIMTGKWGLTDYQAAGPGANTSTMPRTRWASACASGRPRAARRHSRALPAAGAAGTWCGISIPRWTSCARSWT